MHTVLDSLKKNLYNYIILGGKGNVDRSEKIEKRGKCDQNVLYDILGKLIKIRKKEEKNYLLLKYCSESTSTFCAFGEVSLAHGE